MNHPRIQRARQTVSRLAWSILLASAALLVLMSFITPPTAYFVFDSEPFFYPLMTLLTCFFTIVICRISGFILKRDSTYWEQPDPCGEEKES